MADHVIRRAERTDRMGKRPDRPGSALDRAYRSPQIVSMDMAGMTDRFLSAAASIAALAVSPAVAARPLHVADEAPLRTGAPADIASAAADLARATP
jgi:hypothetical protein